MIVSQDKDKTCAVAVAETQEVSLFSNLTAGVKPIATKSRRFSHEDRLFIPDSVDQMLRDGCIRPSSSPWRAQVLIVKNEANRRKNRLCIDYSQTIIIYTERDAYPLPRIDDMIKGIASSTSSVYHPSGNGQAEKTVGMVWKAIQLALKSLDLPPSHWEVVLEDVLHSMRSLLCTATNTTPHERFFSFSRRSCSGESLPSWLTQGRKAYLRRFVRTSKHDPLVDEVELVTVNPSYARVRFPGGREVTVNLRDLPPRPQEGSVPCPDRGQIGNYNTPASNVGDTGASPGDSSRTDSPPQINPNVESTPDSPARDTSLPASADADISDDGGHVASRRSALTKGCRHCDTGINIVMMRHFEYVYYVLLSCFFCASAYCYVLLFVHQYVLTSFNLAGGGM